MSLGPQHTAQKPKRVFTEAQREAHRQRARDRWANATPEQKRAQMDRHNRWAGTPEQRQRKREQMSAKAIYVPHKSVTAHTGQEIVRILGGARANVIQKDRGFAPWKPQGDTLKVVTEIQAILKEYEAYLPLTVRQVLYRMMGRYGYEKTIEDTLYTIGRRARRARIIDMDAIRDDGGVQEEPISWDSADDWMKAKKEEAQEVCLDRQDEQEQLLVVHCEAGGMVPQLAKVANPYGVPVFSSGGFDSLTEKHLFGRDHDNVEVLHIGDYDPSGIWMFISLAEDMSAFAEEYGNTIEFTRLAVTGPEQIASLNLVTQDVNPKDGRAFPSKKTAQAEAIAPDELARIVREAIEFG